MADLENSSAFAAKFDKLICDEDTDEKTLYSSQEKQQVSMSMPGPESSWNHYRLLTVILAVLAVVLLAVDIGLGVYYNQLTGGQQTIRDITLEVAKLQASYNNAIQNRIKVKKQLDTELSEQQHIKWDLEHQQKRCKDYEKQINQLQDEIAVMNSNIPLLSTGCRHCTPGWMFLNLKCYFLALTFKPKTWNDARQYCKNWGGDLAVIDTSEKLVSLTNLINHNNYPPRALGESGYWIGLTDTAEENTWKWPDGRRVVESYWNDGEPNNQNNEDCAAMYPRKNPFKSWNDAPCNHNLRWICEMEPRAT